MKDTDWVMYTFNMLELQKKEKEDAKNKKIEEHNEGKSGKDQEGSLKKTLSEKQKQETIHGDCKMQTGQVKWNEGSNTKPSMKDKDDGHVQQGKSENTLLCPNIIDLTIKPLEKNKEETYKEVTPNERPEKENEIKEQKEQDDSFEEEMPQNQHQQQKEHDISDESELNKVTCEDSLPNYSNCILNNSNASYGSKLWTRDVIDGKYHITQGIPGSIKFRSIANLYKCTNRLSPIEDEYNWNLATEEDLNMNLLTEEYSSIITNHKGIGCKRQWRENQKASGEKDATISST